MRLLRGTNSQQQQLTTLSREVLEQGQAIAQSQTTLKQLDQDVAVLGQQVTLLPAQISVVTNQVTGLTQSHQTLSTTVGKNLNTVQSQVAVLHRNQTSLNTQIQTTTANLGRLEGNQLQLQNRIRSLEEADKGLMAQVSTVLGTTQDIQQRHQRNQVVQNYQLLLAVAFPLLVMGIVCNLNWQKRADLNQIAFCHQTSVELEKMSESKLLQLQLAKLWATQRMQSTNLIRLNQTLQKASDWSKRVDAKLSSQKEKSPISPITVRGEIIDVHIPAPQWNSSGAR